VHEVSQLAARATALPAILLMAFLLLSGCASNPSHQQGTPQKSRSDRSHIYLQLGIAYLKQGQPREALRKLQKAKSLNDEDARVYNGLALTYQNLGFDDKAERAFQEAVDLDPKDPQVHNNYGAFLAHMGAYERARRQFEAALADPLYSTPESAYYNLAWLAERQGKPGKAEGMLRTALRLHADYPAARLALVELLRKKGQTDKAEKELEKLLKTRPKNVQAHLIAGEMARGRGDRGEAKKHWKKVLDLAPDSDAAKEARTDLERIGAVDGHLGSP